MAQTNHERVGKALEVFNTGLRPFVEREFKSAQGEQWFDRAKTILGRSQLGDAADAAEWDTAALLRLMWEAWNEVFGQTLGRAERSLVSELIEVRNKWAHQKTFSSDDAYRALDSMERLLDAVAAAKEVEEIERQKMELMRLRFDEQVRHEKRKAAGSATEGQPVAGLKPWREVITPHPDVASGKYQQAEFAADLWQVYMGEGSAEYREPVEFFRRTYLTTGLKDLLVRALLRMSGKGGDPVVELQTNFGGGKTHSMLALFHLFSGVAPKELAGLESVFEEAKPETPTGVRRAVIVGNKLSPGQPHKKKDGTVVHTLWGELAWQLGGKEGYAMLRKADETATNPGDVLRDLFNKYAPCLVLIDEWVAYARQLHDASDLPGGSFETHFTFAQTLSEAAKAAKRTLLVVSIPASTSPGGVSPDAGVSDEEVGGKRGREALVALRNALGRVEAPWKPANAEESFEIVRRRLFQPIADPQLYVARDAVAKAFCDLYRTQHQEFPPECREGDYERRMKTAYPIHPEIFERLYQDWSSLVKFQRTRGVLRLMASVIHTLWEREDKSVLIMPGSIPLDEPRVQSEMTRYLPDGWDTVIEKDVDGETSLPLKMDREKLNLGRVSACRRIARMVFMGSAPTAQAANRGVEDRRIKLGCVQPGESPSIFGDALRHLSQAATYLYLDAGRYWYSTQPTVTKLADDRAEQLKRDPDKIYEEIKRRVRLDLQQRSDFTKIHPFPASSGEVPDELEVRLVVLGVECPHTREGESLALDEAGKVLESRGNSPRLYKNTLVFLAADRTRLLELDQAVRYFLAWQSIEFDAQSDPPSLNLDNFQKRQTATQKANSDATAKARIPETFQWLLVPTQSDPKKQNIEWQAIRIQGQDPLAVRVSKKLRNDGLLATQFGSNLLRQELDRIPLWRGNHVPVKQAVEDFAQYLYLQRLKGPEVLLNAIRDGINLMTWSTDSFAFAESWDEAKKRYVGLQAGRLITVETGSNGLLVRPEVAEAQIKAETPTIHPLPLPPDGIGKPSPQPWSQPGGQTIVPPKPTPEQLPTRFYGSVTIDAMRMGRDIATISKEVVEHLTSQLGSEVEITLDIHAKIPGGVPDKTVRDVSENCRTLKFKTHGFEKE
ncbi:MAG TPA: Swt1 family HEPN domain-containing protein [Candidatus Paceibacterota bacterium]|nr:Swt1 family HEPN domain-containing protein [Candidatus Paceibacterota bacterium]